MILQFGNVKAQTFRSDASSRSWQQRLRLFRMREPGTTARAVAVSKPRPRLAPVMNANFPFSFPSSILLFSTLFVEFCDLDFL
jgi:hypothetical protein